MLKEILSIVLYVLMVFFSSINHSADLRIEATTRNAGNIELVVLVNGVKLL